MMYTNLYNHKPIQDILRVLYDKKRYIEEEIIYVQNTEVMTNAFQAWDDDDDFEGKRKNLQDDLSLVKELIEKTEDFNNKLLEIEGVKNEQRT